MTGQPNRAERFLAHIALGITDRLMVEMGPREVITDDQYWLLATHVRRWIKLNGRVRDIELVIVGTKIPPYLLFLEDLQSECSVWLSESKEFTTGDLPFVTLARASDGGRILRLLAHCFLCAEVLMLLAHRDQFVGDKNVLLKDLYDKYHARNGSERNE